MYEELFQENKNMLWAIARRYRGLCERDRAVSIEDLVQTGFVGLVKAAESFDESTHKGWKGYARWFIIREIYDALGLQDGQLIRPHSTALSLDSPLSAEGEDGATVGDMIADESLPEADEALLLEELRRSVREAVSKLPDPRQRRIIERCYIENKSLEEAALDVGVNLNRAKQIFQRARANMARDVGLRSIADLDENTRFYARKSVSAFMRDRTSTTEEAALWRIEQREKAERQEKRRE